MFMHGQSGSGGGPEAVKRQWKVKERQHKRSERQQKVAERQ